MANTEEAEARRAMMLRSSWSAAAPDAKHEYMPISSNELNRQYTHCKSASASARFVDFTRPAKPAMNPAGEFVASKRYGMGAEDAASTTHSALGSGLVLGYDARETRKSSEMYGEGLRKVSTPINLLESVPPVRDATLDGAHRASMTEKHMPDIWDPYASDFKKGAASFASATMLRDASRRRKRPLLPPGRRGRTRRVLSRYLAAAQAYTLGVPPGAAVQPAADGAVGHWLGNRRQIRPGAPARMEWPWPRVS